MSSPIKNGSLSALNGQRPQQEAGKLKAEKGVVDYFAKDSDAAADRIDTLKGKLRSKDHNVRDTNRENLHWTEHGIVERDGKKVDLLLRDLKLEFNPLSGIWAKVKEFFSWIAGFFTSNTNVMPNNLLRVLEARPDIRVEFESKFSALKADAKALKAIYDILNVYANLPKEVKIDISEQLQLVASYLNIDLTNIDAEEVVGTLLAKFEERSKELEQFFKGTEVDFASAWQAIADDKEFNSEVGNAFVDQILQYKPHEPGTLPKAMLVSKPDERVVVEFCAEGGLYSGVEGARSEYYAQTMTLLADSLNEVVEKFKNVKLEELSFELKPESEEKPLSSADKKLNEKYKAHQKNVADFGVDLKNAYLQELLNSVAKSVFMVDTGENLSTLNGESEGSAKNKISELVSSAELALNLEVKLFALNFNGRSKNLDQFRLVKSNVCVAPKYEVRLQDMTSSQAQMKGYNAFTSDLAGKMNSLVNTRYKNLKDYNAEAFAKLVHKTLELGEMLERVTVAEHKEQLSTVVENQVDYIVRTSSNPASAQTRLEELKENVHEISKMVAGYSKKLLDVAKANGKLGKVFERLVLDEIWRIISSKNSNNADKLDDIKDIKTKLEAFGKAFGLDVFGGVSGFAKEVTEIHAEIARIAKKAPYMLEAIGEKNPEAEPKDINDEPEEGSTEATSGNKEKAITPSSEYSAKFYVSGDFEGKEVVGLEDYLLRKAVVATENAFYALRGASSKPFSISAVSQVKEFAKNITEATAQIAEIKDIDEDLFNWAQSDIKWGGVIGQFEKPASELPNSTLLNHTLSRYMAISEEVKTLKKQLKSSLSKEVFEHQYNILKTGDEKLHIQGWYNMLSNSERYVDSASEAELRGDHNEWVGLNLNLSDVEKKLKNYTHRLEYLGKTMKRFAKYEGENSPIAKRMVEVAKGIANNIMSGVTDNQRKLEDIEAQLKKLEAVLDHFEAVIHEINEALSGSFFRGTKMSSELKEIAGSFFASYIHLYGMGSIMTIRMADVDDGIDGLLKRDVENILKPLVKFLSNIDVADMKSPVVKSMLMDVISEVLPSELNRAKTSDRLEHVKYIADNMKFISHFDKLVSSVDKDDRNILDDVEFYNGKMKEMLMSRSGDLQKLVSEFEAKIGLDYSKIVKRYNELKKEVESALLIGFGTVVSGEEWRTKFNNIYKSTMPMSDKVNSISLLLETVKEFQSNKQLVAVTEEVAIVKLGHKIAQIKSDFGDRDIFEPIFEKVFKAIAAREAEVREVNTAVEYESFGYALDAIDYAVKFADQPKNTNTIKKDIIDKISKMIILGEERKFGTYTTTRAKWENVQEIFADFRREQTNEKTYVGMGMERR